VSKVYDTTNTATLAAGNYTLTGVLGSDAVGISTTAGTYDTIHVGTGKTVTVNALAISGANAGDYLLASSTTAGAVGAITAATLTAGLTGAVSKVYDTTNVATLAPANYSLAGVLGSDAVSVNNPVTGTYNSIYVATGKTVTVNGLAISGANAGDYQLVSTTVAGAVGTITGPGPTGPVVPLPPVPSPPAPTPSAPTPSAPTPPVSTAPVLPPVTVPLPLRFSATAWEAIWASAQTANLAANTAELSCRDVSDAGAASSNAIGLEQCVGGSLANSNTIVFSSIDVAGAVAGRIFGVATGAGASVNFRANDYIGVAGALFDRLGSPTLTSIAGRVAGSHGPRTGTDKAPIDLIKTNIVLMTDRIANLHDLDQVASVIGVVRRGPSQSAIFMVADGKSASASTGIYLYSAVPDGLHQTGSGDLKLLGTVRAPVHAEQIKFEPEIAALAGEPRRPSATQQPVAKQQPVAQQQPVNTARHPDARPASSLEVLQ
jgi:hypothetical protein